MFENRVLRYFIYGTSAIALSEVAYHMYGWIISWKNQRSSSKEICEVIWTNELTQICVAKHRRLVSSPTKLPATPLRQLSVNKSECDNPFCAAYNVGRLLEFIDSAKYCIDLAMYTFTSYELSQAFSRALKRGVLIRIISDHEMAYSSGSQIIPLTKSGVPVRCNANTMFMHHKFCVIDAPTRWADILKKQNKSPAGGCSRGIVLTGSLNWTMQGFGGNWENVLITSNREYVQKYSEEFDRMWTAFDSEFQSKNRKCTTNPF